MFPSVHPSFFCNNAFVYETFYYFCIRIEAPRRMQRGVSDSGKECSSCAASLRVRNSSC